MTAQVKLVPLRCVRCDTPVPADPEEVAWACAQCGQGLLLDTDKGLAPLEIHYATGVPANSKGKPFWVVRGKVGLQRKTYKGSGRIEREAEEFWGVPRIFVIPGYTTSLEEMQSTAMRFLKQPPALSDGNAVGFEPVTLSPSDLEAAVQFVVLAIEAERKDKLKRLEPEVVLEQPVLWVLPFINNPVAPSNRVDP